MFFEDAGCLVRICFAQCPFINHRMAGKLLENRRCDPATRRSGLYNNLVVVIPTAPEPANLQC